jgi:hypothetical protein
MAGGVSKTIVHGLYSIDRSGSGIDYSFQFGEYNKCGDHVNSNGDVDYGADYLVIEVLNGQNDKAASTVGRSDTGNALKLNPAPNYGTGDPASNMAHELGLVVIRF